MDAVFHALSDASRRLIIEELHARDGQSLFELCVRLGEVHGLGMTRQAISKHLAALEAAGLVRVEWRGRIKLHFLDLGPIRHVHGDWLARFVQPKGDPT